MTVTELLEAAQFLVDTDGKRKAVLYGLPNKERPCRGEAFGYYPWQTCKHPLQTPRPTAQIPISFA